MKKIILSLLLFTALVAKAQVYNNEWIDYSKTYYKFKVGSTGLYRLSQSVLAAAGLGNTPVEYFQLWRNGAQVPLYTTIPSGQLTASDYIEFWAERNDGKPDKPYYRDPSYQICDQYSLISDTAIFFLTINPVSSNNLRISNAANNVAGNSLPVEPYFMYKLGGYPRQKMNPGMAVNVGEYMYSSSYDKGEMISSLDVGMNATVSYTIPGNLAVYSSGPAPKFKVGILGNAINARRYVATINNDSIVGNEVDYFNFALDSTTFNLSTLASNTATVNITNLTQCITPPNCPGYDAMNIVSYEITYPRKFDFGGSSNFEFYLPATGIGNYLEITNFTYGSSIPILYDLSNGVRYTADLSAAPMLKFALPASSVDRRLILVSEDVSNITQVATLKQKNFINYTSPAYQGDYIIISNPLLYSGQNGTNPVDLYRQYRSSAIGGGYNAKVYEADELVDQFGFGLDKNPLAIRNFLLYARNKYAVSPKFVFIIGKGVNYMHHRYWEGTPEMKILDQVPTWGWPASDVMLTADPGSSSPVIPIGRLSAISSTEVELYLNKVKEYELAQNTPSPAIADRGWMKNVVHIVGTSDGLLKTLLDDYMHEYKQIITDTAFGAHVVTFSKNTVDEVVQLNSTVLANLFAEGISLITYFGHSSATTLEFNLDNPSNYNNVGKYPLFIGLGCNAGDFFNYNLARLSTLETISERYVLNQKGTIGFIASTHFGIVHYLDIWNSRFYNEITNKSYNKTIGEQMKAAAEDVFAFTSQEDFYARSNVEESELHGDPAIHLNTHLKPDYVIEDNLINIPSFVSVSAHSFKINAKFLNIGKAVNKPIVVEVKRTFPNNKASVILRDTIPGLRYADSLTLDVPIDPNLDKGTNKITVTVDADNAVDELYETNNSITKNVVVYENEAKPIYPAEFAIINKQNIKLKASTANPFIPIKQYRMEIDTTRNFNSSFKISKTVTSPGGVIEFDPGIIFTDSTVYYWRVAPDTTSPIWNYSSFVYLANSEQGYNQSHYFQYLASTNQQMSLDNNRRLVFDSLNQNLFIKNGVFLTATVEEGDLIVSINGIAAIRSACVGYSLIFNVFDQHSFKPWFNWAGYAYGSGPNCDYGRQCNFEYSYMDPTNRKKAMDFMDTIPVGAFVVVRNILNNYQPNQFAAEWMADTALYGHNNDLYHKLKGVGFDILDSFNSPKAFAFVYQKGVSGFKPVYNMSKGLYDEISLSADFRTPDTVGTTSSPQFGPAKSWKEFKWAGNAEEVPSTDDASVDIIGVTTSGSVDTLIRKVPLTQTTTDISSINATQYPYLQLHMNNKDTGYFTPYQLRYWRVTGTPAPEGAVAPNILFQMKDTLEIGEPIQFKLAFKNVSDVSFDSVKVNIVVTDKNNIKHILPINRLKPIVSGDTAVIQLPIDTKLFAGNNNLMVEVNPDSDQPELYHFNNLVFRQFYVRPDTLNPLMDVTFDNVHILNHDIVSAKPNVVINLKDDAKWLLLNDKSVFTVQVVFPDKSVHQYNFNSDTLQFVPASGTVNQASAIFKPIFTQDGEYQLIVSGQDMSQNKAGTIQYKVSFQVINKPMISNMLNYPNPFTTSTAFVFTITGSEVPQNIKIQIMTVTGKIIREITKNELGYLHIGRNITDFKWDGTDQYGQKLGNGVYLYHVVTNLNGKALDKYTSESDNTDKFFVKGYGKMYLMR